MSCSSTTIPNTLEWLSELVKGEGFTVATADSLRAARIHLTRLRPTSC